MDTSMNSKFQSLENCKPQILTTNNQISYLDIMADDTSKVEQLTTEMDDLSFDPTMKKKKSSTRKKSVAFEDPSTPDIIPDSSTPRSTIGNHTTPHSHTNITGEGEEDMFSGKKKKAKKILVNAGDGDEETEGAAATTEEVGDLDFSSLKKKKKKRVIDDEVAALEAKLEEAGVVDDKEPEVEGEDPFATKGDETELGETLADNEEDAWLKSDRDYTYEEVAPPQLLLRL
jgi:translation initiation factor 2 subunit 2